MAEKINFRIRIDARSIAGFKRRLIRAAAGVNKAATRVAREIELLQIKRKAIGVTDAEWAALAEESKTCPTPAILYLRRALNDRDRRWHRPKSQSIKATKEPTP